MRPKRRRKNAGAELSRVLEAALLCGVMACCAEEPVTATRADGLAIDGRLDETAWREGPWRGEFQLVGTGAAPTAQTKFAVRFDDRNLYFAAECEEPATEKLKAETTRRDGSVWGDDSVELLLDAGGFRNEYLHVVVNSRGVFYDAWRSESGSRVDAAWDAALEAAARVAPSQWTVEMAIPLADLGLGRHSTRTPWGLLVARTRLAGGQMERSAHVPNAGAFHEPASFGSMRLDGADLQRFLWEFPGRPGLLVSRAEEGKYALAVDWSLRNLTGLGRTVLVAGRLAGLGDPVEARAEVEAIGEQTRFGLLLPLSKTGEGVLEIGLADKTTPAVMLARRQFAVTLRYVPLAITLTAPFYRNNIYATENLEAIEGLGRLNLPATLVARPLPIEVALSVGGEDEKIARQTLTSQGSAFRFRLPVANLAEGRYLLRAVVQLPDGTDVEAEQTITKLPRVANEWRLGPDRSLLHNGRPFLPYGMFAGAPPGARDFAGEGLTAMFEYHRSFLDVPELLRLLDRYLADGRFLLLDPWPKAIYRKYRQPLSDDDARLLADRVRALKEHPAILGWYLEDEPDLNEANHARYRRAYEVLRETDPYHPVVILPAHISGIERWADVCDIIMPDPYPRFLEPSGSAKPLSMTSDYMDACRKALSGGQAWWIVPQAFNWTGQYPNSRAPNFLELRNQQLQGFIGGARGLFWYRDGDRLNSADLAIGLPFLGREAARIRDAVLAADEPDAIKVEAPAPEHLKAAARKVGEHWFVLAVNTQPGPQEKVVFTVPGVGGALHVVSENRAVQVEDGRFRDTFQPFEGHIYTTDPAFAFGETVAAVQARIDSALGALAKPGNLAHRSTGATLTASVAATWDAHIRQVNDGYVGRGWRPSAGTGAHFIEVNLPKPAPIRRVVVYGESLSPCRIEVLGDAGWEPVFEESSAPEHLAIQAVFAPRATAKVRLLFEGPAMPVVREVEVYER